MRETNRGSIAAVAHSARAGRPSDSARCRDLRKKAGSTGKFRLQIIAALLAAAVFSPPVAAKLFKWVDEKGVTHYGEVIPPEYANKSRSELDKNGLVVKQEEVLTPEQRRAKEEADAKKREDQQALAEQQLRDRTLINTYSNVNEIELARKRNLQQIDARINAISSSINATTAEVARLEKEANGYTKSNRQIPVPLNSDLHAAREKLNNLNKNLERPVTERAAVNARYDADKARYMQLTGKD
jgi:uncharacterized membrane protein YdfJ with MMPL/SSD domain